MKKHALNILGALLGAVGGFAYYHYIGCSTGTCPISSNPYISIAYGAVLGVLLVGLFTQKKQQSDDKG